MHTAQLNKVMMSEQLLVALLTMGGLGLILSLALALANKKLKVEEDPRIEEIAAVLPGLNCVACGFASCHVYAEQVVQGNVGVDSCSVGGEDVQAKVAAVMKVQVKEKQKQIACIHCQGGEKKCKRRFRYQGVLTCGAANIIGGGDKACVFGCLGYGDCVRVCPCAALEMNDNNLPVVKEEKCTGCGLCVQACPRNIISLIPHSQKVYLGCVSQDKGKQVKEVCTVGCFACTLCASPKITPGSLIVMKGNLPEIKAKEVKDWQLLDQAVTKCPAGCYVVRGDG